MAQTIGEGERVGSTPIQARVEVLEENTPGAARAKALEILNRKDTLLVIGNLDSESTAASLPIYLGARPQVPFIAATATDDNLLAQCDGNCFQTVGAVPLLQLPPTNSAQATSGFRFAVQSGRRRFLLVSDGDPANKAYSDNLSHAYYEQIDSYRSKDPAEPISFELVVGKAAMEELGDRMRIREADCLLYTGSADGARIFLAGIAGIKRHPTPMVILSDASLSPAPK